LNCRITNQPLKEVFSLGTQRVNGFVDKENINTGDLVELKLGVGPTGLLQLFNSYPPNKMYQKYFYNSSINESMKKELKDIVDSCHNYVSVSPGDLVLDIASNSGELLTNWDNNLIRVGIDPCDIAKNSDLYDKHKMTLINDYFSKEVFSQFNKKAKVITIIAMFYDLDNPIKFIQDVKESITDDGLLVIQMSYTPLMFTQNELGNISEEHLCYYTLDTLKQVLDQGGFTIIDCQLNPTNGGSFRVYAMPNPDMSTMPLHEVEVCKIRVKSIQDYESANPLDFNKFSEGIELAKKQTLEFLTRAKEEGKLVIGLGSSTKGNTLLQYFGITPKLLPFIAERYGPKVGKFTAGTGIPIISEEEMREKKPDYLFVLPWHFIRQMALREQYLLSRGTKLVVPLPELKVY